MTYAVFPGGGNNGDVIGPNSSVDNEIVLFNGTTGKSLQGGGVGTVNQVLLTDGVTPTWGLIANANVDATAAIAYSKLNLTGSIVDADINASAAIAYSKLNLTGSIVNADINASAAIDYSKLATLTASRALQSSAGGVIEVSAVTSTELGYVSGVTSAIQTQIDGKVSDTGDTMTGALTINTASNQLILSSGVSQLTLNSGTSAAARTYTVPDVGTSADFVMTAGAQTIAGAKTFSESVYLATSSGNVGIGTSSPGSRLTIKSPSTSADFLVAEASGTTNRLWYVNESSGNGLMLVRDSTNTNKVQLHSSGNSYLTGGNVGIGTTSPGSNLHVESGTVEVTLNATLGSGGPYLDFQRGGTTVGEIGVAASGNPLLITGVSTNDLVLRAPFASTSIRFATVTGGLSGSVSSTGAWTLGPSGSLTHSVNGATVEINSTSTTTQVSFAESSTRKWSTGLNDGGPGGTDGYFWFCNSSSTYGGGISTAGAWTLGPSSGAAVQHDLYSSYASLSSNQGVIGLRSTGSASGQIFLQCNINSTTPNGGIQRNGTTNGVQFFAGSDARIKENITDAPSILNKLMGVKIREYTIRGDVGRNIGVVAQELINVFPEKVHATDDGMGDELSQEQQPWTVGESWHYELIKAIQELKAELDALKGS